MFYRVRIEPGARTCYLAPPEADSLTTFDRFAARRFRNFERARREADRVNAAAAALTIGIPSPAYVEEFA
jgi:hypothetical protein